MRGVDELMNFVMSHLVKFGKLPMLKIHQSPEDDDLMCGAQETDAFENPNREFKLINPGTTVGLKKMTQLLAIAALIAELKRGIAEDKIKIYCIAEVRN